MFLHQRANHADDKQQLQKIIMHVTTSEYVIRCKNRICSVKMFSFRAWYTHQRNKNSLEQAAQAVRWAFYAIKVLQAKQLQRKLVSGFSFTCNKYPPQFPSEKSNDSSMREGISLDALNWFKRRHELCTPKSVGREGSKAWALSVVSYFSLSPEHLALSHLGWFSHVLTFCSLFYPWEKMGTTRSLQ